MTETQRNQLSQWVARRPHWWACLMLLSLHAALAWDIDAWWARGLMLMHFGFFLLWQPVWRTDREITLPSALLIIGVGLTLGYVASWWLMALWLGILAGLIGGRTFGSESLRQRLAGLIALGYVLGILLGWVVPHLFVDYQEQEALVWLMRYGWSVFPLALLFIPQAHVSTSTHVVDFIYSVMLFLLVMVLVLGSFALKQVTRGDYLLALALTLLVSAGMLLILAWLWKPRAGFAGFGQLLSRYLLSVGLPFEQWLRNIARRAETEREADVFLQHALREIGNLPWVSGGYWRTVSDTGEFGTRTPHHIEINSDRLMLDLYTRGPVSPALVVHVRLLTELISFFYEAKRREQLQRQSAYLQAIHETGARLTHDVKNLLQSLTGLCAAAESSDANQSEALQALIKRQLPLITQRLDQTLKKLKSPHAIDNQPIAAATWWKQLQTRYASQGVTFELTGDLADCQVPAELFDSVADNLLQNALKKRGSNLAMTIEVQFAPALGGELTVQDSGYPMPNDMAAKLFDAPVASNDGLGIGLYQAARQAERLGYRLRITENVRGTVRFELGAVQET